MQYYEIDGYTPDKEIFIRVKLKANDMIEALNKCHDMFKKSTKLTTMGADKIHKDGTVVKGEGKQAWTWFPVTRKRY